MFDYFDMIRKEIETSAQNVIEQTVKYKDRLIDEIDQLKRQLVLYFRNLCDGALLELRKKCGRKKIEWQNSIEIVSFFT